MKNKHELTIKCRYSCIQCGIDDQEVFVPARTTEDVVQWLEGICMPALCNDHAARSPNCHPKELHKIKIPVPPGTDRIGGAPQQ